MRGLSYNDQHSMLHDIWLARRVEATLARTGEDAAEALERLDPARGACFERVAGGSMIFAGVDSFNSHVLGVGVGVEVSEADLDRIESFYAERGAPVELDLCPFADPTLAGRLFDRGYRPDHFEQALVCPIDADVAAREILAPEGMALGLADKGDPGEAYGALMSAAFDMPDTFRDALLEAGRIAATAEAVHVYFARQGEDVVAAGAMSIHEGVVSLFGAATLPEHRGRGLQSRLLALRLREAARRGCDLAVVTSLVGSTSQRNIERAGFRPAYTRTVLIRPLTEIEPRLR